MKKIKLFVIFLLTILMVPVYAKDFNVSVDSISLEEKSGGAKDLSKATFDNLDLNLNLRFFDVGDYVKYKVVIANDSDNDYFISDDPVSDDYLKYTYSFDNDSYKLDAHSTKVVYLTVSYEKEVESDKLVNNKYTTNLKQAIIIADKDGNIINPDTFSTYKIVLLVILLIVIITSMLLFIKKKKASKVMVLLLLLVPLSVLALETLEININTDVTLITKAVNDCTFDGELVQGAEYVNGQYTYRYMQEVGMRRRGVPIWQSMEQDGWGVVLTDTISTDPITTPVCTSINGKPIVSMRGMYAESQSTSVDLSSLNTTNVVNMFYLFGYNEFTELDLSYLDTRNATDMSQMFVGSKVTNLDISGLDTSKVTDMASMFASTQATSLDLSGFDTHNVTNMLGMFASASALKLDLNSFDTSNVTNMYSMFNGSKATSIDISSFDTSKVTDMTSMFSNTEVTELNVLGFNTSSVVSMQTMFYGSKVSILDLSSFDMSNVTDTGGMFYNSLTTTGYARTQADADKFNSSGGKPEGLVFTVKG